MSEILSYKKGDVAFAVANMAMPRDLSLDMFSEIISQDGSVFEHTHTRGGELLSFPQTTANKEYHNVRKWSLFEDERQVNGVALFPKLQLSPGLCLESYAYGFQGTSGFPEKSKRSLITGLYRHGKRHKGDEMLVLNTGYKSVEELEEGIEKFSKWTGINAIEFNDADRKAFEEDHEKVIDKLIEENVIDFERFAYLALLKTEVGDKPIIPEIILHR
ncbi:MAG: hypothetical protein ABIH34_07165 [Nanoarchaeota archaeon]